MCTYVRERERVREREKGGEREREREREGESNNLSSVLSRRDFHFTKAVDKSLCL